MLDSIIKAVIGGALGLLAIAATAKVAYDAGREDGREEQAEKQQKTASAAEAESKDADTHGDENGAPEEPAPRKTRAVPVKKIVSSVKKKASGLKSKLDGIKQLSKLRKFIRDPESAKVEAYVCNGMFRFDVKQRE